MTVANNAAAIKPRDMLPQFTLRAREGPLVRVSDFRGRKNLVVIFPAGRQLPLVSDLVKRESELEDENVVVLVVQPPSQCPQEGHADGSAQFRFLCDQDGEVSRRFGAENTVAVYITDQYGEVYSASGAAEETALPDADEVLASLQHINAACPE